MHQLRPSPPCSVISNINGEYEIGIRETNPRSIVSTSIPSAVSFSGDEDGDGARGRNSPGALEAKEERANGDGFMICEPCLTVPGNGDEDLGILSPRRKDGARSGPRDCEPRVKSVVCTTPVA